MSPSRHVSAAITIQSYTSTILGVAAAEVSRVSDRAAAWVELHHKCVGATPAVGRLRCVRCCGQARSRISYQVRLARGSESNVTDAGPDKGRVNQARPAGIQFGNETTGASETERSGSDRKIVRLRTSRNIRIAIAVYRYAISKVV